MTSPIVISGPASWNRIVLLDRLPEPVPHMQFALGDWETIGGTSAGKALGLAGLGRPVLLHTLLGADAEGDGVRSALEASGVRIDALPAGRTESHLNLMTREGGRVSLYLSAPGDPGTPPSGELEQAMADAPPRTRSAMNGSGSAPMRSAFMKIQSAASMKGRWNSAVPS